MAKWLSYWTRRLNVSACHPRLYAVGRSHRRASLHNLLAPISPHCFHLTILQRQKPKIGRRNGARTKHTYISRPTNPITLLLLNRHPCTIARHSLPIHLSTIYLPTLCCCRRRPRSRIPQIALRQHRLLCQKKTFATGVSAVVCRVWV